MTDPRLELTILFAKAALRKQGLDPTLANDITAGILVIVANTTNTVLPPTVMIDAPIAVADKNPHGGSGAIIAAILAFLASPGGQAFIMEIIKLIMGGGHVALLALIGEHGCPCVFDSKTGLWSEREWVANHPPVLVK